MNEDILNEIIKAAIQAPLAAIVLFFLYKIFVVQKEMIELMNATAHQLLEAHRDIVKMREETVRLTIGRNELRGTTLNEGR